MSSQAIQDFIFAMAAASDGPCFVARQTGLEVSHDQGQSWQTAYRSLALEQALPTTAVAISPAYQSDQTVFAGVHGNLLRSQDGGQTWQFSPLPAPPPAIVSIVFSPDYATDDTLFAATLEDGVLRSSNRGASWNAWNFGLLDSHIHCLLVSPAFAQDDTLWVGTESGIFASHNRGRGWRELPFPMDQAPVLSLTLVSKARRLITGTQEGLLFSEDQGQTWQPLQAPGLSGPVEQLLVIGSDLLALVDGRLWYSPDGGNTWSERPLGEAGLEILVLAAPQGLRPADPLWLGLADGRVVRR
ncbi:MAG: hypothetical protein JW862_01740 [Anaerolineales bacterium]|nr:hypothetical protein [Anaerolineales bacterium]